MSALQQHTTWTAYVAGGTSVAVGDVMVLNSAGTYFVKATLGNRTAAGRDAACIALTAYSGTDVGSFEPQIVGVVPANISGLGAGTASAINVSDAGVLQRCATSASDIVGKCDTDGVAYIDFAIPWDAIAAGGGGTPGGADTQLQRNNAGAFGAVTGATSDGTNLTVKDANLLIVDDADTTKIAKLQCSSITTGTTRTYTLQDASVTLAGTAIANGGTGATSIASGIVTSNGTALSSFAPGANVQTFLTTPSSANLASAVTDETGSGALVFANTPTLVTPVIGAATGTSVALSSFGSFGGGTPHSSSTIRLPNAATIGWKTSGGVDRTLIDYNSSNQFSLGTTNEQTTLNGFFVTIATGGSDFQVSIGGTVRLKMLNAGTGLYLGDTTADHFYVITPSELSASRTCTLPLLTGNDEFVFKDHTQTLTNKTLTSATMSGTTAFGGPILGNSAPYGNNGHTTKAMADANQALSAAEYSRYIVETTGALTANRTLTWPHPASADESYTVTFENSCTGFSVVCSTGTGTTVTVAPASKAFLRFTTAGVNANASYSVP